MLKPILHPANQDRTGARDCFCCPALLLLLLLLRFPSLAARDGERETASRGRGRRAGNQITAERSLEKEREREDQQLCSRSHFSHRLLCVCLMSGWLCVWRLLFPASCV